VRQKDYRDWRKNMEGDERKKLNSKEAPQGRNISWKAECISGLTAWPENPFIRNPGASHILLLRKQEDSMSCSGRSHPHITVMDFVGTSHNAKQTTITKQQK
jgi:hypothetical protein